MTTVILIAIVLNAVIVALVLNGLRKRVGRNETDIAKLIDAMKALTYGQGKR